VARPLGARNSIRFSRSLHNVRHYNCAATDYSSQVRRKSSPNEATVFDLNVGE